jgi:pimeloyl-ACP methyl ester carboxylesterase
VQKPSLKLITIQAVTSQQTPSRVIRNGGHNGPSSFAEATVPLCSSIKETPSTQVHNPTHICRLQPGVSSLSMPTTMKPHIVLVHGAWHHSSTFNTLRAILTSHGFDSTAIDLPSTGAQTPHSDASQDTAVIRAVLSKLIVDKNQEVILLLHSYAGVPGSDACEGLLKADRSKESKAGGVLHVIYLASLLVPAGSTLFEFIDPPTWIDTSPSGFAVVTEANALDRCYNGMRPKEALAHVKQLRPQSPGALASVVRFAPWQSGGMCTYVMAEEDNIISERESEGMVSISKYSPLDVRSCTDFIWL